MATTRLRTSGGDEDSQSSYHPKTSQKTIVVQRGSTGTIGRNRSSLYGGLGGGMGMSTRISASLSPQVYSQMAGSGIADFRDTRQKEKKDMQDCNERLATYIEKVRFLEANCKRLEAENEALRKRKQEDWRPIRDMYEQELNQAREVIKDMSTQKGVSEAKLAGLQDEVESLRELIGTYELNTKDYVKKIDQLNNQIGEYEGELTTLRLRCGSLEDDLAKLRNILNKYKEENMRLRADLEAETAAHIEQEVLAQTRQEQVEFLTELLDKLQLTQQEPVTVKGMDLEAYFSGEIRRCVADIQQTYDDQVEHMTMDYEAKLASQMNQLRSGNVRDTMEAEHAKSECKRLRDQLAERNQRIAELEAALAAMRAEKDRMAAELSSVQQELDSLKVEYNRRVGELTAEVEALLAQLQTLIDAKMTLELEIACYRKLLEGEENRGGLRQLVEQTIGIQSGGGSQLSDLISGSSSMASMQIQKSRTGSCGIKSVDQMGNYIILEVDAGARQAQDLSRCKLVKRSVTGKATEIDLSGYKLGRIDPGKSLTIFAKSMKQQPSNDNEFVPDIQTFGAEAGDFTLVDGTKEIASLRMRQGR